MESEFERLIGEINLANSQRSVAAARVMSVSAQLGRYLRRLRVSCGLSQSDMACSLGLTKAMISHYECGVRVIPVDTAKKIHEICKKGVTELA